MIGKVIRGTRVDGLVYYLYGPGRANEHVNPHVVAGWRHPAELEPALRPDGGRDFRNLIGLLNQPLAALADPGYREPVWHCAVRAACEDRVLDDDEWAQVAYEIMNRTGLARDGDDDGVRWVAVRHADDHVHIVATLARQDGTKPKTWNDFYRVREACQAVERRFGLRVTAPGDRTAARRPTRSETEQARRRRWAETPRAALRRHAVTAAAGAGSEEEFFRRLEAAGVLVRQRISQRNPGEVTGYAIALPGHLNRQGEPVWFGGGKLAADLTLPKLRARWGSGNESGEQNHSANRISAEERREIWDQAAAAADRAAEHIKASADPSASADLAGATSDLLHVAAELLKDRRLREAAEAFDRAAREPYARTPPATPAGLGLRRTVRRLAKSGATPRGGVLIVNVASLVSAVAELRLLQGRAAQAAAARAAARCLSGASIAVQPTAQLAAVDFPGRFTPPSGPLPRHSGRSAATSAPSPSQRRRR
ncbi:relaxase/mobilization nuclease domain-containing protein [Microtetraspora fusca]|uniref:relaxase/mobilization nuclease domain-containing protein n=1 Tax=Microtetraspora fusca TaxID=1997 RepID=UPI000A4C9A1C|nr:relaxase/mobilization nuclease domain-containing protein [Microtetraspora fusca]